MRTRCLPIGLKQLEDELQQLKVVRRQEVAEKLKEARAQGDLSENAEYDAAKDEQRDIEARIEELENILKNAEVVVETEVDSDKINIGCVVKLFDFEFDEELEFSIVRFQQRLTALRIRFLMNLRLVQPSSARRSAM